MILAQWLITRNKRIATNSGAATEVQRIEMGIWGRLIAGLIVWPPVLFGFFLPVYIFVAKTLENGDQRAFELLGELAQNSIEVSLIVAILTTSLSFVLFSSLRRYPHPLNRVIVGGSGLGYAIPGVVIAIGCLTPLFLVEEKVAEWCLA